MRSPSDVALAHLRRLLARDPMLRDVLADAIPGMDAEPGFTPDVDVLELDGRHIVTVELPGVPRDAVRVGLEGARLVIEGTKPVDRVEGSRATTQERRSGAFRRDFLLPADVDAEGVKASLEHGILRVEVPHSSGRKRRSVPIEE